MTPFNSYDVQNFIVCKTKVRISRKQIVQILKTQLNLSFKLGSSRPLKCLSQESEVINKIFVRRFIEGLAFPSIIINIDETSFSYQTKFKRS
jgi:hypothetical protein